MPAPDYNPQFDPWYERQKETGSGGAPVEGQVSWTQVTDKPGSFPPLAHVHDERYPSKTDTSAALAGKAASVHEHDDRYYREGEVNTLLAGKAASAHHHDDRYYTETEVDTALSGKAAAVHDHDSRYYTESEVDTALADKAPSEHQHVIGDVSNLQAALNAKASLSHVHDSRYYTEGEVDALLAETYSPAHKPRLSAADGQPKGVLGPADPADYVRSGTTAGRPSGMPTGFPYFDTTLGKMVFASGALWVESLVPGDLSVTPLVLKYDVATSSWPARPVSNRVVFWLALSDTVPRPAGAADYDVVFRGAQ